MSGDSVGSPSCPEHVNTWTVTAEPKGRVPLSPLIKAVRDCPHPWGGKEREVQVTHKKRGTSYSLIPANPWEIIADALIACLIVALMLGIPRLIGHWLGW